MTRQARFMTALVVVPALVIATVAADRQSGRTVGGPPEPPASVGRAPPPEASGPRVLARSSSYEIDAPLGSHTIILGRLGRATATVPGVGRIARSASYEIEATVASPVPLIGTSSTLVTGLALACAPNPFSRLTTLSFELPQRTRLTLRVFDLLGREVAAPADGEFPEGHHAVEWAGTARDGRPLSNGIYLVQLRANGSTRTRRVALIR